MQLKRREEGVALVTALLTLLVVSALVTIVLARTLNEVKTARDSTELTQSLLYARAGANFGSAMLEETVKPFVNILVEARSSSTSRWAFDPANTGGDTPNARTVATNLKSLTNDLQTRIADLICNYNSFGTLNGKVRVRIYFSQTACGVTLPTGVSLPAGRFYDGEGRNTYGLGLQKYALPFVLVAEGIDGVYKRNVVIQGEYLIQIGRSSFARYGYFSNNEANSDGSLIYFTDQTMIDGPVHTNGRFAFAYDPWFGGEVSSSGCLNPDPNGRYCTGSSDPGAMFYGQSAFIKDENMQPNAQRPSYGTTTPIFGNGVAWDATYIPMPQNSTDQQKIAKGFNPDNSARDDAGISIASNLNLLEFRTVGANGLAPTKKTDGTWTDSSFQVVKTCTSATACTIYRYDSSNTLTKCTLSAAITEALCFASPNFSGLTSGAFWTSASPKPFNGVIHVNGSVDRVKGPSRTLATDAQTSAPAIAKFSQLTLAAENDIRITGDLKYEDPPTNGKLTRNANRTVTGVTYDNLDATNVLGIYSANDDILVGNGNSAADLNAPNNIVVNSILMSGLGRVTVENYNKGSSRGAFNLLGGIIQNSRGAFGTFSGSGGSSTGYDRSYVYDKRMLNGLTPPFFPTTGKDEVKFVQTVTFGQREQVY